MNTDAAGRRLDRHRAAEHDRGHRGRDGYVAAHAGQRRPISSQANAAVHSYTVAFWWAAAIFAVGAVLSAIVLRPGVPQIDPDREAVVVV